MNHHIHPDLNPIIGERASLRSCCKGSTPTVCTCGLRFDGQMAEHAVLFFFQGLLGLLSWFFTQAIVNFFSSFTQEYLSGCFLQERQPTVGELYQGEVGLLVTSAHHPF